MSKRGPEAPRPGTLLVFVTTEGGYALEGYEVEAAGFLVKEEPHAERRFQRLMERLGRRMQRDVVLELAEGSLCLLAGNVCYAEVRDHNMVLHTRDGAEQVLRMTMEGGDTLPVSRRRTQLEQAYAQRSIARLRREL